MGILFAIFASLFQALAYVSIKKSFEKFPPSVAFFLDVLFGLLIWIPFSLIVGFDERQLFMVFGFALLSAILSEAFVFYAFSKGEISVTGTIFASYPIYTILLSALLVGERLILSQWAFVLLTIFGTLIVSFPERFQWSEMKKKAFILWPLAAAFAVGLSDSLSKGVINKTSAETFLFALAIAQIPVGIAYLKFEKQSLRQFTGITQNFQSYKFAVIGSFANIVAVLFLWLAFQQTLASLASPITATYPGIIVLLAFVFLKERVSRTDLIGILLVLLGIFGVSLF